MPDTQTHNPPAIARDDLRALLHRFMALDAEGNPTDRKLAFFVSGRWHMTTPWVTANEIDCFLDEQYGDDEAAAGKG